MLKAIIILPGSILGVIPAVILYFTGFSIAGPVSWPSLSAVFLALLSLPLMIGSMLMFHRFGHGTPAPWDPPKKLMIKGPYRYMRNPMLTGVFAFLAAEALFFQSVGIGVWLGIFVAGNLIYFPLFEEKDLVKRFARTMKNIAAACRALSHTYF